MESNVDNKKTVPLNLPCKEHEYKKVYITGFWADVEDSEPF